MRIGTKLMLGVLVPLSVAIVVCMALVLTYRAMEVAHENGDMIRKVRTSLGELNHLLFAYVTYREERPKQQFLVECDSLTKLIASIRLGEAEQRHLLEDIRRASQSLKEPFRRLVSTTDLPGSAGTNGFSREVEEQLVGQLLTRSHRADSNASRLKSLVDEDIKNTHQEIVTLILGVLVLATTPLTFMLLSTRRSITTSLSELHKGTKVVRSGNLDYSITVKDEDEIGELSHAFNQMTASLKEVTVSKSDLETEMVERRKVEEALRKAHDELETRVQERTRELANANEILRGLSAKLLSAQEDERKRIASDLHDTIGSCLVAVKYKLESALQQIRKIPETAESLDGVLPRMHEAIEECRRIQQDLRPSMIDDLGLLPTLSWFCRTFEQIYPTIRIEQKIDIAEGDIPNPLKIVVFRVTQEAMNNIAKHSKADLVRFSLRKLDDRIELALQDNGRGFSLRDIHSRKGTLKGLGLTTMRERAGLSGGSFDIESGDGKGTTVIASWPCCRRD
jgi:signal transduction histidine kinase